VLNLNITVMVYREYTEEFKQLATQLMLRLDHETVLMIQLSGRLRISLERDEPATTLRVVDRLLDLTTEPRRLVLITVIE